MQFHENRPIYMQIVDYVCDEILSGDWTAENRIPSVREMAAQIEVNPNTAMRAYHYLQERGVLEQKRGVGYFASEDAQERVLDLKRRGGWGGGRAPVWEEGERLGGRVEGSETLGFGGRSR